MNERGGNPSADDPDELARMMKAWRVRAGLNTADAGGWLGLSARTIEGIEQGRGFNAPRVMAWAIVGLMSDLGVPGKNGNYILDGTTAMCEDNTRQGGMKAASTVTPEMIEAGIESLAGVFPDAASDTMHATTAVCQIWAAMLEQSLATRSSDDAGSGRVGQRREP